MNKTIKKYTALFLLALFVFPYIQKGIHDLHHAADFHCQEKSIVHFHETEHHCNLCDEVITKAENPDFCKGIQPVSKRIFLTPFFYVEEITKTEVRFPSLRGPPAV